MSVHFALTDTSPNNKRNIFNQNFMNISKISLDNLLVQIFAVMLQNNLLKSHNITWKSLLASA